MERLDHLDGLRGVLAWWVVAGHLAYTVGWTNTLLLSNALAVDVFIILSGFVIYRMIDRKREPYAPYIIRRACRLFPVYLPVLIVSTLMLPLVAEADVTSAIVTERTVFRSFMAQEALANLAPHLAAHLALVQGLVPDAWLPGSAITILGQAWSVSMEWQFYLIAPFVFFGVERGKFLLLGAGCAALVMLAPSIGGGFIGDKAHLFGLGIATYLFMRDRSKIALLAATGFAVLGVKLDGVGQLIPLGIWLASLLPFTRAAFSTPSLVWLGDRSYSVYLVHMIPIYLAAYLAPAPYFTPIVVVAAVCGTALLAELTFRLIERPGMALGKALTSPKVASGAAI